MTFAPSTRQVLAMGEYVMNTAEAVTGKADAPTIEIAAHAGTCYGVQRALDMALAAARKRGRTLRSTPWARSS